MSRILIIEDEPDIVRGLELNLRAEGYDIVSAATGPDGLQAALRDMPDLVLLDIMLPGMSGLDVCRELRARKFDRPIIMLTPAGFPGPSSMNCTFAVFSNDGLPAASSRYCVTPDEPTTCSGGIP